MRTGKLDLLWPQKGPLCQWSSVAWLHVAVRKTARRLPLGLFGTAYAGYRTPAFNLRTQTYGSSATAVSREPVSVLSEIVGRLPFS